MIELSKIGGMDMTQEEIERYAPYHAYPEFKQGFDDYMECRLREYDGVKGQAYDRGAECAMRRSAARLRAKHWGEIPGIEKMVGCD
jgi:hypothetical protein